MVLISKSSVSTSLYFTLLNTIQIQIIFNYIRAEEL